jgi:RNA polymerase sigma-70 factor (ECF subfamily)
MPSNQFLDDYDIINGCLQNNATMQKMLYDKYAAKMHGIALRYTHDQEEAKDILQDGFVKVFQNLNKFKGTGAFEGWLRRIFVNTAIEHYRKKNNTYEIQESHEESITDHDVSALDKIATAEILNMVKALPNGYRTVFNLYAIEGYTHKEIAEMLNISEGTSKSQYARAKGLLQEKIKNHEKTSHGME